MVPKLPIFDLPKEDTSVEGLYRHVLNLLDEEGIQKVIIGGNSLGGHIALLMAIHQPERVDRLILAGSSGLFERGFELGVPRRPKEAWVRNKIKEVFFDPSHVTDALVQDVIHTMDQKDRARKIVQIAKSAKKNNLKEQLHRICCPVMLVWGADDQITPPKLAHEFNDHLPHSELHFIPRCGHAPTLERPHEFIRIVEEGLSKY